MLYRIYFLPQMKRCVIITYKHGISLDAEQLKSLKTSKNNILVPSLPTKMKILLILVKNS